MMNIFLSYCLTWLISAYNLTIVVVVGTVTGVIEKGIEALSVDQCVVTYFEPRFKVDRYRADA